MAGVRMGKKVMCAILEGVHLTATLTMGEGAGCWLQREPGRISVSVHTMCQCDILMTQYKERGHRIVD